MPAKTRPLSREERRAELLHQWNSGRYGRNAVLSLFHRISPAGQALKAGITVFDVILDHEFGERSPDQVDPAFEPLAQAMRSLRGHAQFALLGQIHQIAADQFGFNDSLEEAASLLARMPGVRVESEPDLAQSRVFARDYWSAAR